MLLNKRRVIVGGALVAILATQTSVFTSNSTALSLWGIVGGAVIGLQSEDRADELFNGAATGFLGGLLFAVMFFLVEFISVIRILRPLNALHYATVKALPMAFMYPFMFAMEGIIVALVVGYSLQIAPSILYNKTHSDSELE